MKDPQADLVCNKIPHIFCMCHLGKLSFKKWMWIILLFFFSYGSQSLGWPHQDFVAQCSTCLKPFVDLLLTGMLANDTDSLKVKKKKTNPQFKSREEHYLKHYTTLIVRLHINININDFFMHENNLTLPKIFTHSSNWIYKEKNVCNKNRKENTKVYSIYEDAKTWTKQV